MTHIFFPVIEVLERALDVISPGFSFDIRDVSELGDCHGLTDLAHKEVLIREDVYLRACENKGRDRLTIAHEIGHSILHSSQSLSRTLPGQGQRAFESVEWQASAFAGELLVPYHLKKDFADANDIVEKCAVSLDAAKYQWKVMKK